MKTKFIIIAVAFAAVLCVSALGFGVFWVRSQARDVAEYLPPQPAAAGVEVQSSTAKVWMSYAARHFTFSTTPALTAGDVARLFEPQLVSAGWERVAAAADGNVATSSWRHREKINGGLYLVFSVLQLDPKGKYLGTMTTTPYWPQP